MLLDQFFKEEDVKVLMEETETVSDLITITWFAKSAYKDMNFVQQLDFVSDQTQDANSSVPQDNATNVLTHTHLNKVSVFSTLQELLSCQMEELAVVKDTLNSITHVSKIKTL